MSNKKELQVSEYMTVVLAIARRIYRNTPPSIELDDLVQEGCIGLLDAIGKYDAEKQPCFLAYAKHRIKGAIIDSLRKTDYAKRQFRADQKVVNAAIAELTQTLGQHPTDEQLLTKLDWEKTDLIEYRAQLLAVTNPQSLSAPRPGDDGDMIPALQVAGPENMQPDLMALHNASREEVRKHLSALPPNDRRVMDLMYGEAGLKQVEITRITGLSQGRISQIHKKGLLALRAALEKSAARQAKQQPAVTKTVKTKPRTTKSGVLLLGTAYSSGYTNRTNFPFLFTMFL